MILRMSLGVVLAGSFAVGGGWRSAAFRSAEPIWMTQDSAVPQSPRPPAAWLQGDPADSLYRAAREALDRRDYRSAADLFAQVPSRFPRSGYAADAYYWRAFSLYRLGGTAQLKTGVPADDQLHSSWFVGFAPCDAPRYAFAVLFDRTPKDGEGADAAPYAARVIDACYELLGGRP